MLSDCFNYTEPCIVVTHVSDYNVEASSGPERLVNIGFVLNCHDKHSELAKRVLQPDVISRMWVHPQDFRYGTNCVASVPIQFADRLRDIHSPSDKLLFNYLRAHIHGGGS